MATATVPVKSAWASKINWTQAAAAAVAVLVSLGVPIDDQTKTDILTAVVVVQSAATWIIKTWFTPTVTAASVGQ